MSRSLRQIADAIGAEVRGDASIQINGLASIAAAQPGALVFASDTAALEAALASRASAVLCQAAEHVVKPLLLHPHPKLAFARAAALLEDAHPGGVHASAVVDSTATIGPGSSIGANAVIGAQVAIGAGCRIEANATIYAGTTLGDRVVVQAGAVLGSAGFGYVRDEATGEYLQFPQIGRLVIEDDVEIGANCTIDRGALDVTRVRRGTKLDNMVHIGHNVEVGEDVVIAAQSGVSGSSVIESGVIMGGQVGIADHVRIGEGAILGAQCGVPSNKVVRGKGVLFWGTPARPIREYLRELATLARLAKGKGQKGKAG